MTCRYVGVVGVVAVLHVYSLRENIFCTLLLKSEWVCRRDTLIWQITSMLEAYRNPINCDLMTWHKVFKSKLSVQRKKGLGMLTGQIREGQCNEWK